MPDHLGLLVCPPEVAEWFPASFVREHGFFPLAIDDETVTVAVSAPLGLDIVNLLQFVLNRTVRVREILYPTALIRESVDTLYGFPPESLFIHSPPSRQILEDGTIVLHASGWGGTCTHWTGWIHISPDEPDHALWTWLCSREDLRGAILNEEQVEAFRQEYLQRP